MKNWLKRLFASKELDELERWRVKAEEQRRWLAEFPEVAMALDNLIADGKGMEGMHIQVLREKMRDHRNTRSHMEFQRGRKEGYERRDAEVRAALV